ncbi:hypothetical protein C8J57DRAFT_1238425 [Mycena rebaudengoi]|nr:hypothetical protein C8J57DRAFT_1238425 [Mycena rebaudengoi]
MPFIVTLALGLLVICVGLVLLHLSKREQQEELEKTPRLCGEFWQPGILSESMQDVGAYTGGKIQFNGPVNSNFEQIVTKQYGKGNFEHLPKMEITGFAPAR